VSFCVKAISGVVWRQVRTWRRQHASACLSTWPPDISDSWAINIRVYYWSRTLNVKPAQQRPLPNISHIIHGISMSRESWVTVVHKSTTRSPAVTKIAERTDCRKFSCNLSLTVSGHSLKLHIENCGQTAADWNVVTIESRQLPIRWYYRWSPMTYYLVTILHDWYTIVRYDPSRSSKVNDFHVIWKPLCDFLLVINISHCLATIHPWRMTDRQTADNGTLSSTVT